MATFVTLINFTDQGARNVKDTLKRAEAFKATAARMGVSVKEIVWTLGRYDLVAVIEGTDEACTAAEIHLGMQGNVRTETLRAYSASEFAKVLGQLP